MDKRLHTVVYAMPGERPICTCHRCIRENDLRWHGLRLSSVQMIVCQTCGNKRCPQASDHRLACTGSNDPDQPGSIYTQHIISDDDSHSSIDRGGE